MKGRQKQEDPEGQALQDLMASMSTMRQNRIKGLGQPAPAGLQPSFTPPPGAPPAGAPPAGAPAAPPMPAPSGVPPQGPVPAPAPDAGGLPPGMDPRLAEIIRKKQAGVA